MQRQKGQAIVLVVIAMLALLALMGLAIDGGRQYTARRQVQNAADAAALAGTRELALAISKCPPDSPATVDAKVRDAVLAFARQNGVQNGVNGIVRANYVNANQQVLVGVGAVAAGAPASSMASATGVSVTLVMSQPTTFLRAINLNQLTVPANAMAMAGPVRQMTGGVVPIAYPVQAVEAIMAANKTQVRVFEGDGNMCSRDGMVCPTDIHDPQRAQRGWLEMAYIYNAAHNNPNDPYQRALDNNVGNKGCTKNADGSINIPATGTKGWSQIDCQYPLPIFAGTRSANPYSNPALDGDFIAGDPGARASTQQTVCENYMNKTMYVPLFDYVQNRTFMGANFTAPAIGWINKSYYHIVGFMAVRLDYCDTRGNNGYMDATFINAIIGNAQLTPGQGFNPSGQQAPCTISQLQSVSLWR